MHTVAGLSSRNPAWTRLTEGCRAPHPPGPVRRKTQQFSKRGLPVLPDGIKPISGHFSGGGFLQNLVKECGCGSDADPENLVIGTLDGHRQLAHPEVEYCGSSVEPCATPHAGRHLVTPHRRRHAATAHDGRHRPACRRCCGLWWRWCGLVWRRVLCLGRYGWNRRER